MRLKNHLKDYDYEIFKSWQRDQATDQVALGNLEEIHIKKAIEELLENY